MTLLELLRWLVATWPEVPASEWRKMAVLAASVGFASGYQGTPQEYLPEAMLARWLTWLDTDEYAERCRQADAALEPKKAFPEEIVFSLDDEDPGLDVGWWSTTPGLEHAKQVIELDRLLRLWSTRLEDFGAAGLFRIAGWRGLEEVVFGREIWGTGTRKDFLRDTLILPDGALTHGARASLIPFTTQDEAQDDLPPLTSSATAPLTPAPAQQRRVARAAPVRERIKADMRRDIAANKLSAADLEALNEEAIATQYGASRDTCRKARQEVLEEFR
jgi:hypothetical protein